VRIRRRPVATLSHNGPMCGRFTLTSGDVDALARRFGADLPAGGTERYNVAPTEEVLVVGAGAGGARQARLVRWGLVPSWAQEIKGPPVINARAETLGVKKPFAALVARADRRCLVLADGFYEWLRPEDRRQPRQPFRFALSDGEPFAFAGLWGWARPGGEWRASATIVTCAPNPLVARLHDRMPVILPGPDAEQAWLTANGPLEDTLALCAPLDAGRMTVLPANPAVNRSGIEEGPELHVAS